MNVKPLPPLPFPVLEAVEKIEEYARKGMAGCVNDQHFNLPKAIRLLSTCSAETLDLKAAHYLSLPDCCEYWIDLIGLQTREILLGLASYPEISETEKDELKYELQQVVETRLRHWRASLAHAISIEAKPGAPVATKLKRHIREPNPELLKNKETVNHKQAAEILGITGRTLNRWIKDKRLTPIQIGGRNRYKTRDLRRLLNENKPGQSETN